MSNIIKQKELVCYNCDHYDPDYSNQCMLLSTRIGGHAFYVSPDWYCKDWRSEIASGINNHTPKCCAKMRQSITTRAAAKLARAALGIEEYSERAANIARDVANQIIAMDTDND